MKRILLRTIAILTVHQSFAIETKIIEYRENFLEIEVDSKEVSFNCERDNSPDYIRHGSSDLMGIRVRTKEKWRLLFFARKALPKGYCDYSRSEIKKVLRSAKRVRITATSVDQSGRPLETSGFLERIRSDKECFSYFEGQCAPDKYWLGQEPGKPKQWLIK